MKLNSWGILLLLLIKNRRSVDSKTFQFTRMFLPTFHLCCLKADFVMKAGFAPVPRRSAPTGRKQLTFHERWLKGSCIGCLLFSVMSQGQQSCSSLTCWQLHWRLFARCMWPHFTAELVGLLYLICVNMWVTHIYGATIFDRLDKADNSFTSAQIIIIICECNEWSEPINHTRPYNVVDGCRLLLTAALNTWGSTAVWSLLVRTSTSCDNVLWQRVCR